MREARLDALKGFAILCVVLYHATGQYFSYSQATGVVYYDWAIWLRAFLFSFMLPLFAFLSGYVLGRPGGFRPNDYFRKRTLGLLVPYVAWETLYGPGADKHPEMLKSVAGFFGYYGHILLDPHWEGRMWYLYVLWIALMFLGLVRWRGDKTWAILLSIPVVWLIGTYGQFHWLRWIYVFVSLGVLWRRFEPRLLPKMRAIGIAGAVAFVVLWLASEPEKVALDRVGGLFSSPSAVWWAQWTVLQLPILAGVCAVAALVAVSYRVPALPEKYLAYLGTLSLAIYVTHFKFVEMWKGMPAWFLPVNVVIATALAVGATLLLGKWRVTATVFLGEPWVRKSRPLGDIETETL